MYPVIVLREELVCLVILLFLALTARSYRMGKDSRVFSRLLMFAYIHVVFDIITVLTVNNIETVPHWANYICHVIFYMSAILYSMDICTYVFQLLYPEKAKKFAGISLAFPVIYLMILPLLSLGYKVCNGTNSSCGSAASFGYALAFLYFLCTLILIFKNFDKISFSVKSALLPMIFILIVCETVQVIVPEFLFTGGAVTIVTVGFFFSLENPVHVFEMKAMTDALTGLKSRHSYEEDMIRMDKEFRANPSSDWIFAYCDINALRSVNRLHGHHEGDNYITLVAKGLSECLTGAEAIYRLGGDEFLAVYHQQDEKLVAKELEKIQRKCEEASVHLDYIPSVAVGYAVSSKEYKSLADVVRTADYIMYRNKSEMRLNQSFVSTSAGTRFNLSGLTDSVFSAMCASSDRIYPFITNLETGITRVAPAWAEYFGLESEFMSDFVDKWKPYIHPDDVNAFTDAITNVLLEREKYFVGDFRAKGADGRYVTCRYRGSIYHGKDGDPDIFAGYLHNFGVPETVDSITGLPNFIVTDEYVQATIDNSRQAILVKLGINQFSRVNMIYGYLGGDTILRKMADIIISVVKDDGKVFCQDGVNFSLFLPDCTRGHAVEIYDKLAEKFSAGISIDNATVPLEISGGAYEIVPGMKTDRPTVRSGLIYALDESVYVQHSHLVFYDIPSGEGESEEVRLLASIHHDAITEMRYFFLHYQLIVDSETGKVVGAEALLRWIHPEYGKISPGRFISFLENDPCYYHLGLSIIRRAVRDCVRFKKYVPDFRMNVNITAIQLQNEDFVRKVTDILRDSCLPPDSLVLELTERCKELDDTFLRNKIKALRDTGIRIALDDMGTGYSTVSLLLNTPVDEIKLDHGFTKNLEENESFRAFAEALARGASLRDYVICFEGVETQEILNSVRRYGKSLCQGYYFSHPVSGDEIIETLAECSGVIARWENPDQ